MTAPTRRNLLFAAGAATLAGCDAGRPAPEARALLRPAQTLTHAAQRALLTPRSMAREFQERDISRFFPANGAVAPGDPAYRAMAQAGFSAYRLRLDGLVIAPQRLSLEELRALPSRRQVTRHDCVEGWSAIAAWRGVPLSTLLHRAQLKPEARYIVFHCADRWGPATADGRNNYYESIDLFDAFHPQTILAYEMNDAPLAVAHGAPLRLRVERQLGYKHAKYVMRIEAVASLHNIRGGRGGTWEDVAGYQWYAGI